MACLQDFPTQLRPLTGEGRCRWTDRPYRHNIGDIQATNRWPEVRDLELSGLEEPIDGADSCHTQVDQDSRHP